LCFDGPHYTWCNITEVKRGALKQKSKRKHLKASKLNLFRKEIECSILCRDDVDAAYAGLASLERAALSFSPFKPFFLTVSHSFGDIGEFIHTRKMCCSVFIINNLLSYIQRLRISFCSARLV